MKTLKTISTALSLTLLVSAVSAPAMWEGLKSVPTKVAVGFGSAAKFAAKNIVAAAEATDKKLFGKMVENANGELETQDGVFGLRNLRFAPSVVRAGTVAAIVAAPVVAYKLYSYLTAEEAEEVVADEANEPVQNVVPTPVEVTATEETPAVEAPKADAKVKKAKRNPFAKRTARRNVAPKAKVAKAPKAKVAGCKNGKCSVRRSK